MSFIKGAMFGTIVSAGAIWMCAEMKDMNKKKIMPKHLTKVFKNLYN